MSFYVNKKITYVLNTTIHSNVNEFQITNASSKNVHTKSKNKFLLHTMDYYFRSDKKSKQ